MASDDKAESREPFPAINRKQSELKVGWDYKLSKTTPSIILPPTRVHNLRKHHHQLGSSVQIPNPYSKHHSMSVCIWASSYIRYVCVCMYKPIYVCLGMCVYVYLYICVCFVWKHVWVYICSMCLCVYIHMVFCLHVCSHVCECVFVHFYIGVYLFN